uniref:RWD domain-containing protein n=1 Tax=Arion vulgaris TaxID=1028688 RepID=A0A0B6ZYV7_9EUPU
MTSQKCLDGLDLQLTEVDMLTSMYANHGEFTLDDPIALELIRAVVSGDLSLDELENRLGFIIKVVVENEGKRLEVELVCNLPHEYPFVKPQIFIRAPDISRERQKLLREDLNKEIENLEIGEIIVGVVVEWFRERLYAELQFLGFNQSLKSEEGKALEQGRNTLTRLWIYSHHIYSKMKRKDIMDWGIELHLHGFCLPGKPGIICAEGATCDVDEFWYRVRNLKWKRIVIKEQEVVPMITPDGQTTPFKLDPFSELLLDARGGKGREYHMDLGQFSTYLQKHDSGHVFNLFFGLDAKNVDIVD